MSVVPGTDRQSMSLVCDYCGFTVSGIGASMPNWDIVWALVTKEGWDGSASATGPHRCPQCAGPAAGPSADPPLRPAPPAGGTVRGSAVAPARVAMRGRGTAAVVDLCGDVDVLLSTELRGALDRAVEGHRDVVIDLSEVGMIDSTALGLLVRAHVQAKRHGGIVCLVAPSLFVETVLRTTRLSSIFPVFPTAARAVDWLARQNRGSPPDPV